ncbi:MAG: hypothetical protein ACK4P1_01555 [Aggregatilineales bacterium]
MLYFHAAAPDSSPAWMDDMCSEPSAPASQSAAEQHHTGKAFQTSLALAFAAPELTSGVETVSFTKIMPLDDESAEPFALAPPPPPPRLSEAEA